MTENNEREYCVVLTIQHDHQTLNTHSNGSHYREEKVLSQL